MYLLRNEDDSKFSLVERTGNQIPPYAILSHTWLEDHEEPSSEDLLGSGGRNKAGYSMLTFCAKEAMKDGLEYFWVDTCCINKRSSADLSEAINSMFRWYQNAERCYVYLSDIAVDTSIKPFPQAFEASLRGSRCFTRG